ncbi:adenosylcobinamide-GDP ribazoletransferase [Sphingobium yanoikuyae]|uniref:adenosylcobinamide-GDP ribazoletransferase n=1 Tax=Sphingobium yanoikuyae TaxID=13690 RepID=UPI0028B037D0|nr:adenosylcobinamide-GDP ribazoletransferase [Sphingobium yanoikuyae]
MKGLILAIQFLTRLPMLKVTANETDFARSIRWFPAAGAIVGLSVMFAVNLGVRIDPWVGALAGLLCWVGVTGALHLDGLGDIADACGAVHKGRDRLQAVLADPHVGSFGAVAIGLQLIAKLLLLHALVERGMMLPLLLIPFAARIGPLLWARMLPPLHAGLGARFADAVKTIHISLWISLLIIAAWWLPALLAAPLLMLVWGLWLKRKLGGISGDGHGAGIELVESGLLFVVLIAGGTA